MVADRTAAKEEPIALRSASLVGIPGPGAAGRPDPLIDGAMHDQAKLCLSAKSGVGDTGIICIPMYFQDLFVDREATLNATLRGIELAAQHGATLISATGMIPAATDGLLAVQARLEESGLLQRHPQLRLTTGHETVVAAFALNVEAICRAAHRDFNQEQVTCVGLGHIGAATVELLARLGYRPRALRLVDVQAKQASLQALAARLRESCGYDRDIEIIAVPKGSALPHDLYGRTTFYLGATSQADIIDIDALQPGAMGVDDSFPLGFDGNKAVRRVEQRGDVLLTIAGALDGEAAVELRLIPSGDAALDQRMGWIHSAAHAAARTLTGCVYSSVLVPHFGLPVQLGKVNPQHALSHYHCYRQHGFTGAPIHLFVDGPGAGAYLVKADCIAHFRDRFGRR